MSDWNRFLIERGATLEGEVVTGFGDLRGELAAARDGAVLCDLAPLGAIAVSGPEAEAFLQGQLTSDVAQLAEGAVQRSAWCSAKGRVVASFLLRRIGAERFELLLPASLLASTARRLSMYVLRSKVKVEPARDIELRLGLGGPAAAASIAATIAVTPAVNHATAIDGGALIALSADRFLFAVAPAQAPTLWNMFSARARPAGFPCWEWLTIRGGVPVVTPPTQEAFIPQMLNLDALGAVAFDKGCYPGQEIVARTHYLGRLKERLVLAHVEADCPDAGEGVFAPAFGDQACGTIVNAAPAPDGGSDVLAVVQSAATSDVIHLRAADGPVVALLPLPYALPPNRERAGRIA
jgi:folate-binding protein YgfZ